MFLNLSNYIKKTILVVFLALLICMPSIFAADTNVSDIQIYSGSAIAIDTDTGDVLYSKNADEKVFPASTTKILTAILAIENLDLNKTVIVSKTAVMVPPGSSNVGLREDEVISVKDLLYCLLLNSGNDSANVLAESVSGSVPEFVNLMNNKVTSLGCTGTHFANAHGYHDPNHYTTASDMMRILAYASKNETFREICGTKKYVVEITNKVPEKRYLQNTNRLILNDLDSTLSNFYPYCLGGKTGFTDEARRTFVAYGKKDDMNVVIGNFDVMTVGNDDGRYVDAIALFEYSFNNFSKRLMIKKDDFKFEYIDKVSKYKYVIGIENDVYSNIKKDNIDGSFNNIAKNNIDLDLLNKYKDNTTAEAACQVVGTTNLSFTSNLQTINKEVPLIVLKRSSLGLFGDTGLKVLKGIISFFLTVFFILFVIILLLIIRNILIRKRKRAKKRRGSNLNNSKPSNYIIPTYYARCSNRPQKSKINKD